MGHALVTIVCPLSGERLTDARTAIDRLGNPANEDLAKKLGALDGDGSGTHFASLHAIESTDGKSTYLLLEFSADGSTKDAIARFARTGGDDLRSVLALASDWSDGADMADYLTRHSFTVGGGWTDNPGVGFAGTPGMSVGRIQLERRLTAQCTAILADQPAHLTGLERMARVRAEIAKDPTFEQALTTPTEQMRFVAPNLPAVLAKLVPSFITVYLWPLVLLVLLWTIGEGLWKGAAPGLWYQRLEHFLCGAFFGFVEAIIVALILVVIAALVAYGALRRAEADDPVDDRAADPGINAAIFDRENAYAQNHMISITRRKPGGLRSFTSRLVFWGLGELAGFLFAPGYLGEIGTIHFARWVTPPGTRDLIFLSNYGGSWESYLEDFITRAHAGLTAVWTNTIGFPRTENLLEKGATDGERFKRYARRSMIPTLFWFCAYPDLTTTAIRLNARIRQGLASAMTEDEAKAWLAFFGSAARPAEKLVSSDIQSLLFGGLGFLPAGTCRVLTLPEDKRKARDWLNAIQPHIAFDDGRRLGADAVITLALGASGLAKLGLSDEALATFPFTFVKGMNTPSRNRILGDTGHNAPDQWKWGDALRPDAALLVYGKDASAVAQLEAALVADESAHGAQLIRRIPLNPVTEDKKEPFGFVDGISQPVIRGTYKGLRNADPIHLVEPGEFILGYPDNRGNMPPGPTLAAIHDPDNLLPLVGGAAPDFNQNLVETPRDLGFNGSFLVIRELDQDVEAFKNFCIKEAQALETAQRLQPPYVVTPDFIAAKIVGRWPDGSSLVRFPYESQTIQRARHQAQHPAQNTTVRPISRPAEGATAVPQPAQVSDKQDNDFLFGTEDPEALRCPFGAHIRRANPRDSLDPGSEEQIAITNRHRIIRVGRSYPPEEGPNPGLLFMCLNGDIERQFEFLQQTWLQSPSFHGLSCEKDPMLGDGDKNACAFTIPTRDGPIRLTAMQQFVTTRGGGYFFLPGKRLLNYLCRPV
jgi:deferrochelatase/peroxidase EfeB